MSLEKGHPLQTSNLVLSCSVRIFFFAVLLLGLVLLVMTWPYSIK